MSLPRNSEPTGFYKSLLNRMPRISGMTMIISSPLVVMSYHIYAIYSTDHEIIRLSLAIGFDLIVIALYRYLNNKYIKKDALAYGVLWGAIGIMAAFQAFVNVYAYLAIDGFLLALFKGGIFPTLVNMLAFVDSRMTNKTDDAVSKQTERLQRQQIQPIAEIKYKLPADESFRRKLITRSEFEDLISSGKKIEELRLASNWKSIKRWSGAYGN